MRVEKRSRSSETTGGVWTSFSDLFTSVAILFLILFFIIMIRQGILSQHSQQKEREFKKFMEGSIPEKEQLKIKAEKESLKSSVAKMEEDKEKLTNNIENLTKMMFRAANTADHKPLAAGRPSPRSVFFRSHSGPYGAPDPVA